MLDQTNGTPQMLVALLADGFCDLKTLVRNRHHPGQSAVLIDLLHS